MILGDKFKYRRLSANLSTVATNLGASRQPHDSGFIASLFALWRPGESDAGAANAAPPDENGVIELNVAGD